MQKKFCIEITMFGRRLRIDEEDVAYSLSNTGKCPHWHKMKFSVEGYRTHKTTNHGLIARITAKKDRYNQHEMARTSNGYYPPRGVPYALLMAIKYLSDGVDLGYKGMFVAHKNGNVLDNTIENLEWVKKDDFFKQKIAKNAEIGSHYGLFTVIGNAPQELFSKQFELKFSKTHIKVKCICGNEETVDLAQIKRANRRVCCKDCQERYGSRNIMSVLLKHGLLQENGKRPDGHKKYQLIPQGPDYDMSIIVEDVHRIV